MDVTIDMYNEEVLAFNIPTEFYWDNVKFVEGDLCSKWIEILFNKGVPSDKAGRIIVRAFNIYILDKNH